jgi:hypothetical protein
MFSNNLGFDVAQPRSLVDFGKCVEWLQIWLYNTMCRKSRDISLIRMLVVVYRHVEEDEITTCRTERLHTRTPIKTIIKYSPYWVLQRGWM